VWVVVVFKVASGKLTLPVLVEKNAAK
jgi:hypothetical protein